MMPVKFKRKSDKEKRARLNELMERYELTSDFVGDLLEVHAVSVRRWRNGDRPMPGPSLNMLESYCAGLN